LVAVGNQMDASSLSAVYPASLLERLVTESKQRASSTVEAAKEILAKAGFGLYSGDSMPFGDPRSCILDVAKEWGADLIVLGSHGRRGLDRFLLGSVSETVAVHAPCSVRVVRSA
jgi:nucleotide-binding universal stress UspA family protein